MMEGNIKPCNLTVNKLTCNSFNSKAGSPSAESCDFGGDVLASPDSAGGVSTSDVLSDDAPLANYIQITLTSAMTKVL